jgi:hypothetical protein
VSERRVRRARTKYPQYPPSTTPGSQILAAASPAPRFAGKERRRHRVPPSNHYYHPGQPPSAGLAIDCPAYLLRHRRINAKNVDNPDTESKPAEPEIVANPQCRVLIVFDRHRG